MSQHASCKNTKVTKQKSIRPDCNAPCKLIIWEGRRGRGRERWSDIGKEGHFSGNASFPFCKGGRRRSSCSTWTWHSPPEAAHSGVWLARLPAPWEWYGTGLPSCNCALQAVFHKQTSQTCQIQALPFGARPGAEACSAPLPQGHTGQQRRPWALWRASPILHGQGVLQLPKNSHLLSCHVAWHPAVDGGGSGRE